MDDASDLELIGSELLRFGFPSLKLNDSGDLLCWALVVIQERGDVSKISWFNYKFRFIFISLLKNVVSVKLIQHPSKSKDGTWGVGALQHVLSDTNLNSLCLVPDSVHFEEPMLHNCLYTVIDYYIWMSGFALWYSVSYLT